MIEGFLIFAGLGIIAGLLAGMFGIGGGIIIVPILIASFINYGFNEEIVVHLAIGTSLASIFFTGASSANAHRVKKSIDYEIMKPTSLGIAIGALLGAIFAIQLAGDLLKILIGCFAILVATQMLFDLKFSSQFRNPNILRSMFAGSGIGFLSSIFGIGGGMFSVPYFKSSGLSMTSSVGTSAACGIPIALFGSFGYFLTGISNPVLPNLSYGYIYLPAVLGISLTSIFAARYGADLAHYLSPHTLRTLMAILMLIISVYMFVI